MSLIARTLHLFQLQRCSQAHWLKHDRVDWADRYRLNATAG